MENQNLKGLARDILQNSTTMVGVCMTVIGLVRVFKAVGAKATTLVDGALAVNSLFFLGSALFSYVALRFERNSRRMENIADTLFLTGLTVMVGIAFFFAFSVI
jgi:hypothetical protein